MGAGRSGSSLVAGSIISAGQYNIGGKLHSPDKFNEKGYFESNRVNKINDDILKSCPDFISTKGLWQGWLGILSTNKKTNLINLNEGNRTKIVEQIDMTTIDNPLCLKDPRFSYCLNMWLPLLDIDTKFICAFRHPSEFLSSLIHLCQNAEYLKRIIIDKEFFENIWVSMNQYILTNYMHLNPLFVNYNQVLYGDGLDKISDFIGDKVNKDFPSKRLRNARRGLEIKESTLALYDQLCCLANCPEEFK